MRKWLNGRAVASQAEGCGFDSRFPLQTEAVVRFRHRGVAQLVARMVRDHEAASSSLATSTTIERLVFYKSDELIFVRHTERYRSGHNGPDSKSGSPQGLVGSNPTRSAKRD